VLDDIVKFVREENVVQVFDDNATNFKVVEKLLMQKQEHLYETPCVAHCIDLIFEDFDKHLKVYQLTIKKERKISKFIVGQC